MKKYLFIILLLFLPAISYAQTTIDVEIIENIRNEITSNAAQWARVVEGIAVKIFVILAGISFIMKFIMEVMIKGEIDTKDSIAFFVKFTITTGFFYYLLDNGIELANSIVESFTKIGIDAVGLPPTFSNVINIGLKLWEAGDFGWTEAALVIPFFILCLLTTILLILIVANLIIEELSAAIMIYVGYFVLALGGFDYTRESTINYFKAILAVSMKILTMILILGITINILNGLERKIGLNSNNVSAGGVVIYGKALIAFVTTFFLALMSLKIPDAVANLVSSAWGNMGGLTMLGAISTVMNMGQKISQAIKSTSKGVGNAVAGYKDYNKNKVIGQKKKEAEARGEDTTLNPMFNKQRTGSGASYYGGKAVAAGADLSKRIKGLFGDSNEQSDSFSTEIKGNTVNNNTNISNNENKSEITDKHNNSETNQAGQAGSKDTEIQKGSDKIENSQKSHLDKGGQNV